MISIILPVYNAENTIKNCIKSLLNQSYQNFEIIIVYKKSDDNTLEIINSIKDNRIKIFFQTKNSGPGGARNIGVLHSNGDFIGFIEADDTIEKDFFKKLHKRIIDDSSDIAWGEIVLNNRLWTFHQVDSIMLDFLDKYKLIKNGASFDKLYRSNLIKNNSIKFVENFRFEDNPFLLKAFFYSKKISLVKNALYFYNPSPWSKDYRNNLRSCVIPIASEMMAFSKENHFSKQQTNLLQKKIIQCFAGTWATQDPYIYYPLLEILENPFFLKKKYLKMKLKNLIFNFFNNFKK